MRWDRVISPHVTLSDFHESVWKTPSARTRFASDQNLTLTALSNRCSCQKRFHLVSVFTYG